MQLVRVHAVSGRGDGDASGSHCVGGLFRHGSLEAGQPVLIHGAGGGVGTLAVQLASAAGARVAATGRARSREPVLELGADVFVDVEREPLEASGEPAVVLDLVGGDLLARTRPLVAADGVVVSAVDPATPEIAAELGLRGVYFVVEPNRDGLAELTQRIDAGELQPIVGELLPLERKRAGAIPGKSVLAVAEAS